MLNSTFLSPTRLIIGANTHQQAGKWVCAYGGHKVLLHHDSGYVKQCGLVDEISAALQAEGLEVVELGGVVPNPHLELVYQGISLCRQEGVDFLLAVGGGSVIDSTKAIAMGLPYEGDVWDFFVEEDSIPHAIPEKSTPIGVVLTIAATGSEASNSCVITKADENLKRFCDNDINRPVFAIENPMLTMSLPPKQTAYGIIDIMSHSMERYFTPEIGGNELTNRLAEAIFFTCMTCGKILLEHPDDYEARASLMLASSLSHNGLTGIGRTGDWASHFIEHELSGDYNVTHGAGLAVIIPAWMKYVYRENLPLFYRWATVVMQVAPSGDQDTVIQTGIARLEDFLRSLGAPVRLGELEGVPALTEEDFCRMAKRVRKVHPDGSVGWVKQLNTEDIVAIFRLAR
ncbi:MAG: iron-containing alcohol dehydrogenase [Oscillospiraceae bacterium]|nr:iron-containing alcohol dehydrogenase [Oscillospiraceae bacterium]